MSKKTLFVSIAIFALLVLAACGGTTEQESATKPEESGTPAANQMEETPEASSPDALAAKTLQLYKDALQDTVNALDDEPEADEAIELVTAIRDKYAPQLVEIGKKRETLDEAGKQAFDSALRISMMQDIPSELYEKYREVQGPYSQHPIAGKLTASINIITQYVNFDLLSKQEPGEAKKYGVYREVEQ